MDAVADRPRDGRASRDGRRVPAGGRASDPWTGSARRRSTKTDNFQGGVHRLRGKAGHHRRGVHRLGADGRAQSSADGERLRALPGADRRRADPWSQRGRDLSGPRGRSRLHCQYASVRRFVAKLRGGTTPEARVVIATRAGEEGQVDYGEGPMVRWPETGTYRRTRLFLFTLAHSRKAVRLLTWRSSAQIWCELHERAFRRLGGTVRRRPRLCVWAHNRGFVPARVM